MAATTPATASRAPPVLMTSSPAAPVLLGAAAAPAAEVVLADVVADAVLAAGEPEPVEAAAGVVLDW
jgi:hypothetical protein